MTPIPQDDLAPIQNLPVERADRSLRLLQGANLNEREGSHSRLGRLEKGDKEEIDMRYRDLEELVKVVGCRFDDEIAYEDVDLLRTSVPIPVPSAHLVHD